MKVTADEVELKTMEALTFVAESLKALTRRIVILEDERDEYKRKWLEAISTSRGESKRLL